MAIIKTANPKVPSSKLDYRFDWKSKTNRSGGRTDWLNDNETIIGHEIIADAGITVDSSAIVDSATRVVVWLSGGIHGNSYNIACKVTTSEGRIDSKSIIVPVKSP